MSTSNRPRLVAPVRTFAETYQIIDSKFGRPCGTYATLAEARTARGSNRRRYSINHVAGARFRAGPCSWCGWTSPFHVVKAGADEEARTHRASHTGDDADSDASEATQ